VEADEDEDEDDDEDDEDDVLLAAEDAIMWLLQQNSG